VLVLAEDLGGGTGNHLCEMVALWCKRGWETVLVTQTPPLVRRLPAAVDVRVMSRAGWYDRFPIAQVRRFLQLRRIVREVRPDIIHTYFFWSIIYGRVLKRLGYAPRLVENREDLGFSWGRGSYSLLRLTAGIPDRIICVADAVRRVAVAREGVDVGRTRVVHNGIHSSAAERNARATARQGFGFTDDDIVVGMVANLPRAVKGGRRLLDAVAPIVAAAPAVRFLLVGLGTDRATLEPELKARGIANVVVGAGYTRDVDACYDAMDISVLTSSTEGLSITLLESMRHGLATVVTKVGGNAELVMDGETGFLVPVDDATAFVGRVVTLARDANLRRAMGAAGRQRVAEHFALERVAEQYLAVYGELLAEEKGR
jgi:glycosyltransferase involved in cell wall biosynthesis